MKGRSIPLCTKTYKNSGYDIAVCGLGYTNMNPETNPEVLQETVLRETYENCHFEHFDRDIQVCMEAERSYSGSCKGDSGGPPFRSKQQ